MKVKYTGETIEMLSWRTQNNNNSYKLENGSVFLTGEWLGVQSVLNEHDELVCDIDSPFFKDNFEMIQ